MRKTYCHTVQEGQVGEGVRVAVTDSGSGRQGKILPENVVEDKEHCEKAEVELGGRGHKSYLGPRKDLVSTTTSWIC